MGANRLLPVLALAVLAILIIIGLRSCDSDQSIMTEVPRAAAPDADTPADTIRTLTAHLGEVKTALEGVRQDNQSLRNKQADLEHDVRVAREGDRSADRIAALTARIEELSAQVHGLNQQKSAAGTGEVPVGFGLDGEGQEAVVWVRPLDQPDNQKTGYVPASATAQGGGLLGGGSAGQLARQEKAPLQPYYTVPRNATLIGGTGLTALIGRVPIKGAVRDPVPFKVIVGRENLAANGYDIPGIEGMIFSGYAVGDWTLACVHGRVTSVTFVFQDGTIRTVSADRNGSAGEGNGSTGATANQVPMSGNTATDLQNSLGWISDDQGIPCVSGKRVTNAPSYLASRVGLTAAEAAAAAAAASETTTILTGLGGSNSAVTGDKSRYVWASALQGGVRETDEWLKERMENSYDAIFAPPGMKLAVHLDRELQIDYDPQGRRLSHVTGQNDPFRQPDLD
ncbi:MAG: TIGR03752 family integrating conjugative element protein [Lysobacterales bacterium]